MFRSVVLASALALVLAVTPSYGRGRCGGGHHGRHGGCSTSSCGSCNQGCGSCGACNYGCGAGGCSTGSCGSGGCSGGSCNISMAAPASDGWVYNQADGWYYWYSNNVCHGAWEPSKKLWQKYDPSAQTWGEQTVQAPWMKSSPSTAVVNNK